MAVPIDTVLEAKERKALMSLMDSAQYKVPNRRIDENLLLATWNIQNFSEIKSWRSLKYIAEIGRAHV